VFPVILRKPDGFDEQEPLDAAVAALGINSAVGGGAPVKSFETSEQFLKCVLLGCSLLLPSTLKSDNHAPACFPLPCVQHGRTLHAIAPWQHWLVHIGRDWLLSSHWHHNLGTIQPAQRFLKLKETFSSKVTKWLHAWPAFLAHWPVPDNKLDVHCSSRQVPNRLDLAVG
jgi:hypothetical protein